MTDLRLVADNGVTTVQVGPLDSIAEAARRFAAEIAEGLHGPVNRIIAIAQHDDGLKIVAWGEDTSSYELMGLFEAAKLRVFADDVIDDD